MRKLHQNGSSPVLVILIVVVIAAVGAAGYYVYKKQKDSKKSATPASQAAQEAAAACDSDDKNICKFYSSWKDSKYYTVTSSSTSDGQTTTTKYVYVMPDKYHLTTSGDPGYEVIGIGDVTYTKDTASGTWYKQTTKKDDSTQDAVEQNNVEFEAPTSETENAAKTTYKFITEEPCGNFTCFKYQVIDPSNSSATEYIWFDNKDFLLRKTVTESPDGKFESTFSYDKADINEPSPVKELGANEVYVPGQGAVTYPSAQ